MNLFLILPIVIGILGLLYPAYQFLVNERRRLHSGLEGSYRIGDPNTLKNATIVVRHNGVEYSDHTYIFSAFFKNVGNRDICANDFQHPIRISLPESVHLVDYQIEDHHNSKVTSQLDANSVELKWAILKPREQIDVAIILASKDKISWEEFKSSVIIDDRLINVSNSKPSYVGTISLLSCLSIFVAAFTVYLLGNYYNVWQPTEHRIVYLVDGVPHSLRDSDDSAIKACEVSSDRKFVSDCTPLDQVDASKLKVPNPPLLGYAGTEPSNLVLIVLSAITYAGMPFLIWRIERLRSAKRRKRKA